MSIIRQTDHFVYILDLSTEKAKLFLIHCCSEVLNGGTGLIWNFLVSQNLLHFCKNGEDF
jgi:hypothetical protein